MSLDFTTVATTLAATGRVPSAGTQEPNKRTFEDAERCLHLTIYANERGEHWVIVESSFFHFGTRKRYLHEPVVYSNHMAGREAAEDLRAELRFLWKDHGISTINAILHRIAAGNSARGRRRDVIKATYYIGFKS